MKAYSEDLRRKIVRAVKQRGMSKSQAARQAFSKVKRILRKIESWRRETLVEAVEVGDLPPYPRYDLRHVANPSERPTGADYDRYLWLVKLIKKAGCDEESIYRSHPFLVKDVLFSAILVAANEALLYIHDAVRAYIDDAIWVGYLADSFKTIERDAEAPPDGFVYVLRVASTPLGGMVC